MDAVQWPSGDPKLSRSDGAGFHAPRHHRVHVALPSSHARKIAQEVRIGLARSKQISGNRIHLPETLVAEYDVQIFIGIDERAWHVVECDLQVAVHGGGFVHIMERFIHRTTRSVFDVRSVQDRPRRCDYSSFNNTFKNLWTSADACRCASTS
jgi:hypothetical protein